MTRARGKGFTLIELLVVIAIIAILAAMLFPVFARARESARKIQCLSNVKNIAMAVQMYLSDYDRMPPREHRQEVLTWMEDFPGGGDGTGNCPTHSNPFLNWPTILDEYVKNRDIWRCPSAKLVQTARWIVPDFGPGGYLGYLKANEGKWGVADPACAGGPCCGAWPPGWGGSVTDTIAQQVSAGEETGAFVTSIGYTSNWDLKASEIEDASWFVVCADSGSYYEIWMASEVAFPDACKAGCGPYPGAPGCCAGDWANCSWTQSCAPDWTQKATFYQDPQLWKPWVRHMGGSNLGFADGHAAWMSAGSIVSESPTIEDTNAGKLRGMGCIIDFCG